MKFNVFDKITLREDLDSLTKGTVGVILYIYEGTDAYEIEAFNDKNESLGTFTAAGTQMVLAKSKDD